MRVVCAVVALATAATLTGCSGAQKAEAPGTPTTAGTAGPIVVASTDVWGSIAATVAGGDATVRSIIQSGSADPHSYEASAADAAEISDASLVVYNGGGYDPWVDKVLDNRPGMDVVEAYSLLAPTAGEPTPANAHVFYDLGTAKAVASAIADRLAADDPDHAVQYRSRAADFSRNADAVLNTERSIGAARPGASVAATEPVAHYLLKVAGLTDKTPPGFAAAIGQDTDPAPVDVAAMLDLIAARSVDALLFNDQTVTPATRQVREAAEKAGVPVVVVTETLPAGQDYLAWQSDTAGRLAAALQ